MKRIEFKDKEDALLFDVGASIGSGILVTKVDRWNGCIEVDTTEADKAREEMSAYLKSNDSENK